MTGRLLSTLVLFAAAACRTAGGPGAPAVMVHPTAQARAALEAAVRAALGGAPVALADDALTTDSVLILERAPARDAGGRLLQGRELGRPERFQLLREGGRCLLLQQRTGKRFPLPAAECEPREPST